MRAIWHGEVIAESDETIVVEGNHYFPPESVDESLLEPTWAKSVCPWKGIASYFDVGHEEDHAASAAWTYRHPFPWIRKIRNHVAFWGPVQVVE